MNIISNPGYYIQEQITILTPGPAIPESGGISASLGGSQLKRVFIVNAARKGVID
jgi:hypothetical protein